MVDVNQEPVELATKPVEPTEFGRRILAAVGELSKTQDVVNVTALSEFVGRPPVITWKGVEKLAREGFVEVVQTDNVGDNVVTITQVGGEVPVPEAVPSNNTKRITRLEFVLGAPVEKGAPQLKQLMEVAVEVANKNGGVITYDALMEAAEGRIATKQPVSRIFQHYLKEIRERGYLTDKVQEAA